MMKEHKEGSLPLCTFLVRMLQGMLIGLGAVLPGISGGVLCVIFGIYRPVMELLSNHESTFYPHPKKKKKKRYFRLFRAQMVSWSCQYIVVFPGKVSGSIRVSFCRIDRRYAAVSDA